MNWFKICGFVVLFCFVVVISPLLVDAVMYVFIIFRQVHEFRISCSAFVICAHPDYVKFTIIYVINAHNSRANRIAKGVFANNSMERNKIGGWIYVWRLLKTMVSRPWEIQQSVLRHGVARSNHLLLTSTHTLQGTYIHILIATLLCGNSGKTYLKQCSTAPKQHMFL